MVIIISNQNNLSLVVALLDKNTNTIISAQPYDEFQNGIKNIEIIHPLYGEKLFDILYDELGVIRFEENKFALKYFLENNINRSVMRILGKVAEAVIVKRCHEDEQINKQWFSYARRKKAKLDTSKEFRAFGTGLLSTKNTLPQYYNPSDPQRDILWRNSAGKNALMCGNSTNAGCYAGLQTKVSKNGKAYFFNDLINVRYEVPVVYFDLADDYIEIADKLFQYGIKIDKDFISARHVDYNAFCEVNCYVELIEALISRKITPIDLLNHDITKKSLSMQNALISELATSCGLNNVITQL